MTPPEFFKELSDSVHQLRRTLAAFRLSGRITIGVSERHNVESLRAIAALAFRDGVATRDPAQRLDARAIMTLGGVQFRDLSIDPPSRTLVVRAEEAMKFFDRGAVHPKEKQDHFNALYAALEALASVAVVEG